MKLDWASLRYSPLLVIVLLLAIGFSACTTYVAPNEVGIMESRLISPRGIQQEPRGGGRIRLLLPGQRLHRFPTDVQMIEFVRDGQERQSVRSRREPDVEINTSDGSRVWVDVAILYRITDSFNVMTSVGPGRQFEDSVVIPKAISALKQKMGALGAEDFYDGKKRLRAASLAEEALGVELAAKGLEIVDVLIRQYRYLADYESEIRQKKINDQLILTRESEAHAATAGAETQRIQAEGKANVAIRQEQGKAEVTKIDAQADLYSRKIHAEADLGVKLAEAQGTEALNAAYEGAGSENLVGIQMADVLKGVEVIVVPTGGEAGVNPLNLTKTLNMFDVK